MGLFSFMIAAVLDWFDLLVEKDIPQIWLNDFGHSTVCNFSENYPKDRNHFGLVKHRQERETSPS